MFASEIKAILKLNPKSRELDADSINRYLAFLWCPGSGTPLKSIKKLLPGEAMEIKSGSISNHWSWYQLPIFDKSKTSLIRVRRCLPALKTLSNGSSKSSKPSSAASSFNISVKPIIAFNGVLSS